MGSASSRVAGRSGAESPGDPDDITRMRLIDGLQRALLRNEWKHLSSWSL